MPGVKESKGLYGAHTQKLAAQCATPRLTSCTEHTYPSMHTLPNALRVSCINRLGHSLGKSAACGALRSSWNPSHVSLKSSTRALSSQGQSGEAPGVTSAVKKRCALCTLLQHCIIPAHRKQAVESCVHNLLLLHINSFAVHL